MGGATYPRILAGGAINSTVMRGASFPEGGSSFPRKNCMGVPDFLGCQISCDNGSRASQS